MIKNYLKTAWRNLLKNKMHSFINIVGLSVGMAVAMLIGLWIWDELTYNTSFKNYDRIAQVMQNVKNNGEIQTWEDTPYPLADELRKNYSNDFKYVVLNAGGFGNHILTAGDKKLYVLGSYFEPQITELLSLKMLRGSRNGLQDPTSILISQKTANSYFGNADPINKVIKLDNRINVKVAGVYEDMPTNSKFANMGFMAPWKLYFSTSSWISTAEDPWRPNAFSLYVQLADHADMDKVSLKIRDAKLRKVNAELAKKKPALFLQAMPKWHLYSEFKNGINIGGRIQYVYLFGIIGVFVLLLACINFMNLSTARSEKRAKEVGIRKAIGSLKSQLVYQFFIESFLCVFIAFVLSVILLQLSIPFFNEVADKQVHILWSNPVFWLLSKGFCLVTGLIAGSYPAFYLSSFQPVKVLKGAFRMGNTAGLPRKVLVVVQFTVSVTLIIGTVVVFRQIQYAKNRPIGYNANSLLAVSTVTPDIHNHFDVVNSQLLNSGAITAMAESDSWPTYYGSTSSGFEWPGKDPNMSVDFPTNDVSYDYGKTIGWTIKQGRDFSKAFATDSTALVVNETAVKFMNLKDPVGQVITWDGHKCTIIGVVKDMVVQSPYGQIRPAIYDLTTSVSYVILLKLNPKMSIGDALSKIEAVFKQYNPAQPFASTFIDEEYNRKFGNEQRIGKLASFFAGLAIFISCLGLFGMASFMVEQRVKEMGIRKVVGASVFSLWRLLSLDFAVLIIIALVIATPLAYYFMHTWLQSFEYHSVISGWIFILTGLGALFISMLTVSFQSVKAALANPVKSLKTE
jgi:putative ABC transport system permease protein